MFDKNKNGQLVGKYPEIRNVQVIFYPKNKRKHILLLLYMCGSGIPYVMGKMPQQRWQYLKSEMKYNLDVSWKSPMQGHINKMQNTYDREILLMNNI